MYKLFLCLLILGYSQAQHSILNKNVERSLDLTTQLVKLAASITFENTGKEAVKEYLLVNEPNQAGTLSYLSVKDVQKNELKFTKKNVDGSEVWSVQVTPVSPGKSMTINVEAVYTNGLEPFPKRITQKEKQLVRYFGNHYFYSPYSTAKQVTSVTVASKNIENYSKLKPVALADATISYGPYNDIPAKSYDELLVHFENNSPFLKVVRLERSIEISHWGNIAVEEDIEILHTGAKLVGPFSRYDYQRDNNPNHHSIKSYTTVLPATAHNIYYRDSNGNISTSAINAHKNWLELELRPRFPLFGGWKSSYTLGYSVPSYQYLYKTKEGNYRLRMRLLDHVFDDMHVEELITKIVFPVGVSDIKPHFPYLVERLEDGKTHKYLDNIGRQVIQFKKNNLVEQHIQDVDIVYGWQPALLLHEPILIAIALFALFVAVIIYVRIDVSIEDKDKCKKE